MQSDGPSLIDLRDHKRKPPYPFTEFVVKIYERCNLACNYCYMYEMADQTWRDRPVKMSAEVFEQVVSRICEHVQRHELSKVSIVFHGGEPLLRGSKFISWAVSLARTALPNVEVAFGVQTNGMHLDFAMLSVLEEHAIGVGVSLDGSKTANDRHRLGPKGNSSFDMVLAGLERLQQPNYQHLFQGFLATIDIRNDPLETYNFLSSFDPPAIDFLLPHANWSEPPQRYDKQSATPYTDWLIPVFDEWWSQSGQKKPVRMFHNIVVGILGGLSEVETIGLAPSRTITVDTDGSISQVDALKSTFNNAPETGLNTSSNTFDEALEHPDVLLRQLGREALCATCKDCDVVNECGGGYYPHRYDSNNGFDNPSAYCDDLKVLIHHIRRQVKGSLLTERIQALKKAT